MQLFEALMCIVHILLDCPHDDILVHLLTQLRQPLHDSQEDGERDSGLILRVALPHYFGQGLICGTFLYVLKTTLKLHFPPDIGIPIMATAACTSLP